MPRMTPKPATIKRNGISCSSEFVYRESKVFFDSFLCAKSSEQQPPDKKNRTENNVLAADTVILHFYTYCAIIKMLWYARTEGSECTFFW